MLKALDHVNLRTADLDAMVAWYEAVLGMRSGWRPDFPFPGAWLYVDDHPAVHLVGVAAKPRAEEPRIEHFALTAEGRKAFLERLEAQGIETRVGRVPGTGIVQVNLFDPDGNHIHVDFAD